MVGIIIIVVIVLLFGIKEKVINEYNLKKIPLRISVNGIRGKSTVTRLITSILSESEVDTIGKTTGTRARVLFGNKREEFLIRGPLGANIIEVVKIIDFTRKNRSEALVCECMAVNPDYQKTYHESMLKPNISIITNVLIDHIEVLGPTREYIADSFVTSIPYNGKLIITKDEFTDFFIMHAKKRNTKVIVADESKVDMKLFENLDIILFPQNVALALAVAEALEVDDKTFIKGIENALPDPGALKITNMKFENNVHFVNSFAANDVESTKTIMDLIIKKYEKRDISLGVLFNARTDRADRTEDFFQHFFPEYNFDFIYFIGDQIEKHHHEIEKMKCNVSIGEKPGEILTRVSEVEKDVVIVGVGNINGKGRDLLAYFHKVGYNV